MIHIESISYENGIPNWRRSRFVSQIHIIVMVVQGNVIYNVDGREMTLTKGDVLITYPGAIRAGTDGHFPPHEKYSAHFTLELPEAHPLRELCTMSGFQLYRTRKVEYFRQRFSSLYHNWLHRSPLRDFANEGMVMELYASMLQELKQQAIPAHKQRVVAEIESYLQAQFKEPVKIGQIAEHVNLSPNYVSTIFKEVTGQTPIEYMHQLRISVAHDLLLRSELNIAEISDYLGYCEPAYFNRMFKKVMGQPPSALLTHKNA
ncbi:MAG: hypothetical protein K0Q59_2959 [Paenibacillus sp.]|nr:hypothetical protein [Paenibacillus sp.]